ncbi:exonuclease mut-7 homolog isoform X8 [Mustela nigripes]|uniref:exonuclease mut-7 homolog isoform X8 n=1 Tax=Mustela nigripes TaxID=77151 RepID=UPI002815D201|nr:exonuclease mut-7 homolog isoform X8 [Mustela nigripes]
MDLPDTAGDPTGDPVVTEGCSAGQLGAEAAAGLCCQSPHGEPPWPCGAAGQHLPAAGRRPGPPADSRPQAPPGRQVQRTLCPHAVAQQRLAALRHLCREHFVEGSWSRENWTEHVQALVGQDEQLQDELRWWLASPDNQAVAAQCALDLSLPETQLPASVATELRRLKLQGRAAEVRSESRRDGYYQLPIASGDIHFLASWEDLARHEEELLQPGQVLAVDLEWRPSFGTGGRPQASILQLAVKGRVFLLDLPVFSRPVGGQVSQAFSRLVSQMLSDPSITKLGYGMSGDLRSLGASCPALAHVEKQLRGSLDLLQVHRQMRVADKPALGRGEARGPRGLSLLVQQVLGKPLDKAQQLSNWDRRPLSEGQLVYAAADAYCLLEVYQALCREPARFCLSEDLARSLRPVNSERPEAWELPGLQEASASPWPNTATPGSSQGWPSELSPPSRPGRGSGARGLSQAVWREPVAEKQDTAPEVPVRAFRAVCDSMLHGLARSLRCLGADVLTLGAGEDHRRAAEVARQEGRIILTSGLPYHKLRAQVGAGRCMSVDCSLKARQQAKAVLKHFNVRVTPADIFSRCQVMRPAPAQTYRRQAQPRRRPLRAAPMTCPAAGWRRPTCSPSRPPSWATAPDCSWRGSRRACCSGRAPAPSTAAPAAARSSGRAPTWAASPHTSAKSWRGPPGPAAPRPALSAAPSEDRAPGPAGLHRPPRLPAHPPGLPTACQQGSGPAQSLGQGGGAQGFPHGQDARTLRRTLRREPPGIRE